jgi:hypothetical protein
MGPSEKSFRQVKDILGKLDRSIDELRNRRTTPIPEAPEAAGAGSLGSLTLGNGSVAPQPRFAAAPALPPPGSTPPPVRKNNYGRATPLPPLAG